VLASDNPELFSNLYLDEVSARSALRLCVLCVSAF
jgi:hypothetical protein